jgi:hypothetical protein
MPDAAFNEVLNVSVNIPEFRKGLEQLESAYDEFVNRVNEKGFGAGNVLGIGGFSSLTKDIQNLQQQLDLYAEHFATSFQSIQGAMAASTNVLNSAIAGGTKAVDDAASKAKQSIKGVAGANQEAGAAASQNLSSWQKFYQQVTNNIGNVAATAVKYTLAYRAVNAAINLVIGSAEALVNVFKSGLDFLSEMEERAANLLEIFADKKLVIFSQDDVKNFKLAQEASDYVAKKIEEMAAKAGIPVEILNKGFETFAKSGGLHAVNGNLDEAVETTTLLLESLKTTGVNINNNRVVYSEINNLLDGTLSKNSKILTALGMNKAEAEEWIAVHKRQGDLYQALEGKLSSVTLKLASANDRQKELSALASFLTKQYEAIAAGPLFDQWKESLRQVNAFMREHQAQITAVAQTMGNIVVEVINFAKAFVDWITHATALKTVLEEVLLVLYAMIEAAGLLLRTFSSVLETFAKVGDLLSNPKKLFTSKDTWKQLAKEVGKVWTDWLQNTEDRLIRIQTLLGQNNDIAKQSAPKPEKTFNVPGAFNDATATASMKEFKRQLEEIRASEDELRQDTKTLEADRSISVKRTTQEVIKSYEVEKRAVFALIDAQEQRIKAFEKQGFDPNKVKEQLAQLETLRKQIDDQTFKGQSVARRAGIKDDEALEKESLSRKLVMRKQATAQGLALEKQAAQAGFQNRVQELQAEAAIEKENHEERRLPLMQALTDAKKNDLAIAKAQLALDIEDQDYLNRKLILERQIEQAVRDEIDRQAQATFDQAQQNLDTQASVNKRLQERGRFTGDVVKADIDLAKRELELIRVELNYAKQQLITAAAMGMATDEIDKRIKKVKELEKAEEDAQGNLDKAQAQTPGAKALSEVFGTGVSSMKDAFDGFGRTVESLGNAFEFFQNTITNFINAFQKGYASGGVLGGIGGVLGEAAKIDPEPISRGILQIGSVVFGFIGGLFTKEAKRIGEQISKEVNATLKSFNTGGATLIDTIRALERERQEAITRLSGKKGGKDELNKILPDIDEKLASLKDQQKTLLDSFNEQLSVMRLQSDVLGNVLKTWQDINKQVKDYIGAGGSAAAAAEFLSLSLAKIRQQNIDDLNQGEQQAIGDALQLNELLQQRIKLQNDFNKQQFDLINADSLERRAAGSVSRGQQLAQQKKDFDDQLSQLNAQITGTQQKVSLEKQVFNLVSDTAALQQRQNQLNIIALQEQIQKWKDMQTVIASIVLGSNGLFTLAPGFGGGGTTIGTVTVNVNTGSGPVNGKQLGSDISDAIRSLGRSGRALLA